MGPIKFSTGHNYRETRFLHLVKKSKSGISENVIKKLEEDMQKITI